MINKYFPAANTPAGFVNFFKEAIDEKAMKRVIYLKGGPGTGKSTFMKALGAEAVKRGLEIEQLFCSSDHDSLDILKIPALKTVVVDATAPHNFDPAYPVVSGITLNLAAFLDSGKLCRDADAIIALSDRKTSAFKLLYKFLKAAGDVEAGIDAIAASAMNEKYIARLAEEIYTGFLDKQQSLPPRKAFADALGTDGVINMFRDRCAAGKVISLDCDFGVGNAELLRVIEKRLLTIETQTYYNISAPQNPAHISVGNVDLVSNFRGIADYSFDLNPAFDKKRLKLFSDDLETLNSLREELLNASAVQLGKAKKYHKEIEKYYIAAMDFDGVNAAISDVKSSVFGD